MVDNPRTKTNRTSDGQENVSGPAPQKSVSRFAILGQSQTQLGLLELRRWHSMSLELDVYEILLDGDLVMSSAVHVSEDALAERSLHETLQNELTVLIGGLGLGFTARRVLGDDRVRSVKVIELLAPVLEWHREAVLPWAAELTSDPRVEFVHADFFAYLARPAGPDSMFDIVLIDIDDGPEHIWHKRHAEFYTQERLQAAMEDVRPGGILAFWFATLPSEEFLNLCGKCMRDARVEAIPIDDPCLHRPQENFIVIGSSPEPITTDNNE